MWAKWEVQNVVALDDVFACGLGKRWEFGQAPRKWMVCLRGKGSANVRQLQFAALGKILGVKPRIRDKLLAIAWIRWCWGLPEASRVARVPVVVATGRA